MNAGDLVVDDLERALGGAVGGRLDHVPVRERREDAAGEQLEDARDVPLQLAVAVLERVEVVPEGQRRRDVDAVGHEVVEDRDRRPARPQARGAGARWRCG